MKICSKFLVSFTDSCQRTCISKRFFLFFLGRLCYSSPLLQHLHTYFKIQYVYWKTGSFVDDVTRSANGDFPYWGVDNTACWMQVDAPLASGFTSDESLLSPTPNVLSFEYMKEAIIFTVRILRYRPNKGAIFFPFRRRQLPPQLFPPVFTYCHWAQLESESSLRRTDWRRQNGGKWSSLMVKRRF